MSGIDIRRGDTNIFKLTVTRADSNGVPQPVNLAGAKLWLTLKYSSTDLDAAAILQLSSPSGGIVVQSPASAGIALATITPTQAATLNAPASLEYDVQLLEADGTVTTTENGIATVLADVTRAVA